MKKIKHLRMRTKEDISDLLENIDKLHTTSMGEERIRRNLGLQTKEVVLWCKEAVKYADIIFGLGKGSWKRK